MIVVQVRSSARRSLSLVSAGFLLAIALLSLVQDAMGVVAWQTWEAANWAPASRTVPEAIGVAVVALLLVAVYR